MIAVTGATGQLGRLVIAELLKSVAANQIVALVRSPEKAADLAAKGVIVRKGDYNDAPATLAASLAGVDKLLLISSSEVGQRTAQHKAVIEAAKAAGVKLIAYTSLLRAPTSPLGLAAEHVETEKLLAASGVPHVLLRNGWYTENYAASIPTALQYGALAGAAGAGKISSAARADYAAATAAVLVKDDQAGKVYELSGDDYYTLADFAAELSRQTGKTIVYNNLAQADFKGMLLGAGLPDFLAELLSNSDAGAEKGGLFDDSHTLSKLTGKPTTSLSAVIAAALKG